MDRICFYRRATRGDSYHPSSELIGVRAADLGIELSGADRPAG